MTKQRRTRIWGVAGTLALLLLAAGSAWAQDVFASNGGSDSDSGSNTPPVYQDSFSNSCDKSSNSSLEVGGYNPALCSKMTVPSGQKCYPTGQDTVLVSQQGNTCYYCDTIQIPAKYKVIVPFDIENAVYQPAKGAIYCNRTEADACYSVCYGNVPPVVPTTGVTRMPPEEYGATGTPPAPSGGNQPPTPKFQLRITNAPDPCYPAGPKNYWVCDYPNLPRPPGCNCSEKAPTQPPQQTGQPPAKPGQPTSQPGDYPPDPNNYHLGMMVGISSCIQSFPMLGQGMGYFLVGQFDNAAKMWGIEPGQSMLLKDLTTPRTDSNMTPYQQGVIAGQRICGLITTHFALKGTGYVLKNLSGGDIPQLTKNTPGAGEPTGKNVEPTEPTAGKPNAPAGTTPVDKTITKPAPEEPDEPGQPPSIDRTVITQPQPAEPSAQAEPAKPAGGNDDQTPVSNPAASPGPVEKPSVTGERAPITAGTSAQDPIAGAALDADLTNGPNNLSNAPALAGKFVTLANGPKKLGPFKGEGAFAGAYGESPNLVRKLAKKWEGAPYFNEQIEGQANGSKILKSLGIDHPEVMEVEEGYPDEPASLTQEDTASKYPNSKELTSRDFQKAGPELQGEILGAIKSVLDQLASKGYIMGDINPGNFTITVKGGKIAVVIHDPDMIMTLGELNEKMGDGSSMVPQTLNDALGASGAEPYKVGAYANAQALESQLYSGLQQWLYNGPSTK
jgi:hypothetical protein